MVPEYLDVPIFPLPNVTFFPRTLLPLHVFEPRYREMTRACLNGDRLMGVALLKEGWQKDYFGQPPIFKTFGIGKIIDWHQLGNGRYDIVLEGLYRGRLVTEHATRPYRTGRVSVCQDQRIDHRRAEVGRLQKILGEACRQLSELLPECKDAIHSAWTAHPHPGVCADQLASALVVDAYDRQCILEESDPLRRMKLVLVQVRRAIHQVTRKTVKEEVVEEE